jgi:hypothetical protein
MAIIMMMMLMTRTMVVVEGGVVRSGDDMNIEDVVAE